ncbi:hypothetical protein METBIDRAFT_188413 [Metschnikowia bicuspidata var. bicuspidata NRRL YB-4993]|uniref:Uncharacterized protein n=1 Tax=Metschnikowia bicuspidata var. bicuspidata NRRL YB-4993 TaxID=869754 RepID=A0A1A0HCH3_9ASCO|nr:hypothetical protein METBIDRAFT_188413 [Metschnikowia bicuspidata var. bicuspidata NRRL YB-4993]OBA21587.1 hypothetical protein METBIDRAFT_188413 [Metschnikowia bicuspidata var. bicuspidata NRRL YB-4993]
MIWHGCENQTVANLKLAPGARLGGFSLLFLASEYFGCPFLRFGFLLSVTFLARVWFLVSCGPSKKRGCIIKTLVYTNGPKSSYSLQIWGQSSLIEGKYKLERQPGQKKAPTFPQPLGTGFQGLVCLCSTVMLISPNFLHLKISTKSCERVYETNKA